jgi:hypothetical protein
MEGPCYEDLSTDADKNTKQLDGDIKQDVQGLSTEVGMMRLVRLKNSWETQARAKIT